MQKVSVDEIAEHTAKMEEKYPFYKLFTIPKHEAKTYGYILNGEPALLPAISILLANDRVPRFLLFANDLSLS